MSNEGSRIVGLGDGDRVSDGRGVEDGVFVGLGHEVRHIMGLGHLQSCQAAVR